MVHIFTSIRKRLKGRINFDGLLRRYLKFARYCQDLFHDKSVSRIEEILSAFIDNLFSGYASRAFLPSLNIDGDREKVELTLSTNTEIYEDYFAMYI